MLVNSPSGVVNPEQWASRSGFAHSTGSKVTFVIGSCSLHFTSGHQATNAVHEDRRNETRPQQRSNTNTHTRQEMIHHRISWELNPVHAQPNQS